MKSWQMRVKRNHYAIMGIIAILAILVFTNITSEKVSGVTGSIILNSVQSTSATVSSSPYQITVSNVNAGGGTNNLLVVGISANNNVVTSVTYGGAQLTKEVSSFNNNDAEFWYLVNPTGTGNVVVTMAGSTSAVVGVYSFSGVDQTTPIPTSATNYDTCSPSCTNPTVSITTANSNSWVLDMPAIYGGKTLSSPTCTQEWDVNVPAAITGASSSEMQSSAGPTTCSWTASGGDFWDDVAIEVKASGPSSSTVPGSPTGLAASAASSSQINLSWTAPSNNGGSAITGYQIQRSTNGGTTWTTLVSNTGSTATTYSDTGLAASTSYTYQVSAINSVGTGSPSNTASATTSSSTTVPGSPTGLAASAASSSQINLSWTAPSNNGGSAITGYQIQRSTNGGTTWTTLVSNTGSTATTYSDTGLTASTAYTYRVSAINSVGTGSPSNTASATTSSSTTVPGSPTGLAASAASSSQINLSWTAPSNNGGSAITGYQIQRSTNGGTTWTTLVSNTGSTATTYSDTGLAASTSYTYQVSAINSVGTGSPSNTASATTQSGGGTGSIILNSVQSTSATVSSSPYQITVSNVNAGGGTNNLLVVGISANNNVVTSVTYGGAQLTKEVSSFNNNDAEFWYLVNPTGTGNVVVTMAGSTSAVVGVYSFSGVDQTTPIPTSATNHNSGTGSSPTISITTANSNSWVLDMPAIYGGKTLSSPTCTQEWDVNVPAAITGASSSEMQSSAGPTTCSWTASGGGDLWDDVAVEVKAAAIGNPTAPGSPTGLAAASGNSQVTLSWNAPSNNGGSAITSYNIYRGVASGTEGTTPVATVSGSTLTYTDTGLTNGVTYYYDVTAVNSIGESKPSNEANATPATSTVPGSPTGLAASAASSSQINLSWTAPSNNGGSAITGYEIQRSTDGGTTWSTVQSNTGSTATTYSDTGLTASTAYTYRVSAINSVGTGSPSNTASATTQSANTCSTTGRAICLSTNSVNVGTDVKVTGSGFAPNSQITLSYDGTAIGIGDANVNSGSTIPWIVNSDASGNFVAIMQVLVSAAGNHIIEAKDASSNTASQTVALSPSVYMFPTTGKPGSSILIPASQGNGYAASSAITIKFDGTTITPSGGSITTDSTGNFGGSFNIPSTATTGSHTITISDGKGNTYTTPFNVDPNAHSYSFQTVYSGVPNVPANNYNFLAYFAFIPDNGPGVDGSGAFMANEKESGRVDVFTYSNGKFVEQSTPFATVSNLQTAGWATNGLLGIAFDPRWASSPSYQWVYLTYTTTVSGAVQENLVRYHAIKDSSGNIVSDPAYGQQLLLSVNPVSNNDHNGGSIKFDLQGNLYWGIGDGWGFTTASDLTSLQGKVVRITPVYGSQINGKWYTIPPSNPFASSTNASIRKEIWTYGVRHPYGFDLDQKTGKLYLSDVGFNTWESIANATVSGSNAGWPYYEAPIGSNPNSLQNYTAPMYWYSHQGIEPLTGPLAGIEALSAGVFYHGTTYPGMDGAYFFGDFGVGNVMALLPSSVAAPTMDPVHGVLKSTAVPILYGLQYAPIYMEEWNGKIYFFDLNGNFDVINYN